MSYQMTSGTSNYLLCRDIAIGIADTSFPFDTIHITDKLYKQYLYKKAASRSNARFVNHIVLQRKKAI